MSDSLEVVLARLSRYLEDGVGAEFSCAKCELPLSVVVKRTSWSLWHEAIFMDDADFSPVEKTVFEVRCQEAHVAFGGTLDDILSKATKPEPGVPVFGGPVQQVLAEVRLAMSKKADAGKLRRRVTVGDATPGKTVVVLELKKGEK